MATIIGAQEVKVSGNGMTNCLRSVLKMPIIKIEVSMEALAFMQNYRRKDAHCGRKRVARLMQEKQLSARKKRRKVRTTNSNHHFPVAPNLLEQDFTADAPNKNG